MMSQQFRLRPELSGAIAKELPYTHMQKFSYMYLAVSSINSVQIYMYISDELIEQTARQRKLKLGMRKFFGFGSIRFCPQTKM